MIPYDFPWYNQYKVPISKDIGIEIDNWISGRRNEKTNAVDTEINVHTAFLSMKACFTDYRCHRWCLSLRPAYNPVLCPSAIDTFGLVQVSEAYHLHS